MHNAHTSRQHVTFLGYVDEVGLTGHRPDVLLSAIHRPAHESTAGKRRRPDATGLGGLAASQSVAGQMRGPHSSSLVGAVAITRSVVSEMSSVCVLSRVCVVSVDTSVFALSGLCVLSVVCVVLFCLSCSPNLS